MTRIEKSKTAPQVLAVQGVAARVELETAYDYEPDAFHSAPGKASKNIRKFNFKREIYADEEVAKQLRADQHHKCCFCEASFLDVRSGDVEHYRPQSAIKPGPKEKLRYPGYFWLAYDWENLMLSCADCNQKYKRNHFALEDEKDRARHHGETNRVASEKPLLINPLTQDPPSFIEFVGGEAFAIGGNPQGKYTIETLRLNRMVAARETYLIEIKKNMLLSQIDEHNPDALACASALMGGFPADEILDLVVESKKVIARAATPQGKFSACVRANFPKLPRS